MLQLSLGKNLILLTLLDSNIHKHENFKLTLFYMDTCFIINSHSVGDINQSFFYINKNKLAVSCFLFMIFIVSIVFINLK